MLNKILDQWRAFNESEAKAPEVDLMVVDENNPIPVKLAIELKYFTYDCERAFGVDPNAVGPCF
jgi:hypothetical protein